MNKIKSFTQYFHNKRGNDGKDEPDIVFSGSEEQNENSNSNHPK